MPSVYNFKVQCENCEEVATPDGPKNWVKWVVGMTIVFAGIGAAIGTVTGVATAGVGFVAWIFTIPIGIYAGYKIGAFGAEFMDGPSCPGCGESYDTGGLLPF